MSLDEERRGALRDRIDRLFLLPRRLDSADRASILPYVDAQRRHESPFVRELKTSAVRSCQALNNIISHQYAIDVKIQARRSSLFDSYPSSLPAISDLEFSSCTRELLSWLERRFGKSTLTRSNCRVVTGSIRRAIQRTSGSARAPRIPRSQVPPRPQSRSPSLTWFLPASRESLTSNRNRKTDSEGLGLQLFHRTVDAQLHDSLTRVIYGPDDESVWWTWPLSTSDEPEAALSPERQLAALTRIHDLVKARSQSRYCDTFANFDGVSDAYTYSSSATAHDASTMMTPRHDRVMHDSSSARSACWTCSLRQMMLPSLMLERTLGRQPPSCCTRYRPAGSDRATPPIAGDGSIPLIARAFGGH